MLPPLLLGIVLFAIVIFLYSLISNRLEGTIITAPMVFVATGLLLSPDGFDIIAVSANSALILVIAEIALVLVLFSDAARIDLRALKGNGQLPSRLLLIGLPLTIFAGSLAAIAIFTDIAIPEAALIGAILAPTDAGLGQAIVNSPKIPMRIRQALNVESGLNDGGAIPFFAFFLILATTEAINAPIATGVVIAVEQIGLGILVGAAVGLVGGYLVNAAIQRGYMTGRFTWIGFLALALVSFFTADAIGGSGFIAAFVGGMVTAATGRHVGEAVIEFTETGGADPESRRLLYLRDRLCRLSLRDNDCGDLLRDIESYRYPDGPGGDLPYRNAFTAQFGAFHRLVRTAGTRFYCSPAHRVRRGAGVTRSGDDRSSGLNHDPHQHLRPWNQRCSAHRTVRP